MTTDHKLVSRVQAALRDVPDFPRPGVLFKDITPLLAQPALMRDIIDAMAQPFRASGITHVVGVESRGFLFGMPVALLLDAAFVPARKPGKLPWKTIREAYALEYRTDALEMHADAFGNDAGTVRGVRGAEVLIVDDVLATGGTATATCRLVEAAGGSVAGIAMLVELAFLGGRARLAPNRVEALVSF